MPACSSLINYCKKMGFTASSYSEYMLAVNKDIIIFLEFQDITGIHMLLYPVYMYLTA